ncbi:MAG: tRNA 5-methoxyuridine(34)/uridine 5-oxyacetic acid(34) synthase CmoB [Sulfurimonas sp. RIFOXYD12_FULL_33_39]|uniref:tRNA 5-methoxyuridine(34)/uridine 5-oxyacetic acid(34) synthase CmoB n=1 Tax=unclassified Sulfurimonas TaxID=2623549 RepID=UPI0008AC059C|nr:MULTISPECIES: tRNA 5-methoxyuridine(34)/uridine 5-oxyacetic acid(34) synthase CmoB [unclassified Sulfurimonas]OHE08888.1 MAG: tRNA 5-methoxyuridine(34)/uridine 5-oxyacetic acid(34) synthase CmoB [Sulfurimonas sp. RIFOXYD12_FULL_33_39]OHE14198.1 MAG: tRNA 5-methoxyuridine(34)/uridine 5-oxyacetic acid(34) synthase CmoB [Sulfurimonas sp. RIFOXYD2_FULL_34_21]DAB28180.1 MAG TPA: tRNA 5-methoxyuridine(34)/uridine 5-oxyacetic acid(34) synthase CmoB [Sulfurimonas sp. UBA10385]
MNLDVLRQERQKWMNWKNIAPLREALNSLEDGFWEVELGDVVKISGKAPKNLYEVAKLMMPWRKGPFELFETFIDSEWRSNIKYNLLRKHFNLKDKRVADIGCNNGYYLFRMQEDKPKALVGFDPSALYKTQFDFINHFVKSDIVYELLGVEHLEFYEDKFDTIFCLGVLYHRSDPVAMLKSLYKGVDFGGEVILDTFYIDGDDEMCLCPESSYSKIPNIYFVPTIKALRNWCKRAGFDSFEVLETSVTDSNEQRKTPWIEGQSLEDFLDKNDKSKTVEGYPAPARVYVKLTKGIK